MNNERRGDETPGEQAATAVGPAATLFKVTATSGNMAATPFCATDMTADPTKGVAAPQKAAADPHKATAESEKAAALCQEGAEQATGTGAAGFQGSLA